MRDINKRSREVVMRLFFYAVIMFLVYLSISAQEWYPIHVDLGSWDGDFRDVTFPVSDPRFGWIVGTQGMILNTEDGGVTWHRQLCPTDKDLYSVSFIDRLKGWAVGDDGTIVRTSDGRNWELMNSPVNGKILRSVSFIDQSHGWAVGNVGTIIFWNGSEWRFQNSKTLKNLHCVQFLDVNEGWVVGDGGIILHTTDGGQSWEEVPSGTDRALFSARFIDGQNGWIVGSEGVIIHKFRDGIEKQTSNVKSALYDVDFISLERGWIVGSNRELLTTTNGGLVWNLSYLPHSSSAIYAVDFLGPESAVAVGKNKTIVRYTKDLPKLELELVSPSGNVNTLSPEFKWKSTRPDIQVFLHISRGSDPFRDDNLRVYKPIPISGVTSYKLPQGYELSPGTYYWGLEAEDGTRAKPFQSLQFITWSEKEITLIAPAGYIKDAQPTFEWHWLDDVSYTLFIDTDDRPFDGKSIEVGKTMSHKLSKDDPLPSLTSGRYTWAIRGKKDDGTILDSRVMSFVIDLDPPVGEIKINNGAKATNSITVNLSLSASDPLTAGDPNGSGVSRMQISNDGMTWTEPEPFTGSRTITSWDLSKYGGNTEDGVKKVFVRFCDALGWWSEPFSAEIIYDTVAPTGTIKINNGAKSTGSKVVTLTLEASDKGSGVSNMVLRNEGGSWSDTLIYESSRSWDLSAYGGDENEGIKTVYVKYADLAGNWMKEESSASILLDKSGPRGSVVINNGAKETNSLIVNLTLSAEDESGVESMQFTNGKDQWSPIEPFNKLKNNWDLSKYGGDPIEGMKTVYVRFFDSLGNKTVPAISASINYKASVKIQELSIRSLVAEGKVKDGSTVQVSGKAEPGAELTSKELVDENGNAIPQDLNNVIYEPGDGTIKGSFVLGKLTVKAIALRVSIKDRLGNSETKTSNYLSVDNEPPSNIRVSIDRKGLPPDVPTNLTFATVNVEAVGAKEMFIDGDVERVYDPATSPKTWTSYTKVIKIKLTEGDGIKSVKLKFRDELGNTSAEFADSILLDTTKPVGSITINEGQELSSSFIVNLKLSASDKNGVESYQLSNDAKTWTDPMPYTESVSNWDLRRYGGNNRDDVHKVYVKYKDRAGNWSDASFDEILIDSIPPSISHLPVPSSQEETKPVIITAIIQDNRALTEVHIHYRKKGVAEYTTVPMKRISGDYYSAEIPGHVVTSAGVEYYISASDGLQTSTSPPEDAPAKPYSFAVTDTIPPTIQHEPVTVVSVKASPEIKAKVTDLVNVEKVNLYYRINDDLIFKKVEMVRINDEYSAKIPALDQPGVVRYYIEAMDGKSNIKTSPERGSKDPYIISFVDFEPPTILHTPISDGQEAGRAVTISATVTDNVSVKSVVLKYKSPVRVEFIEVNMTSVGSFYKADIPSNDVVPGKIEYSIRAQDTSDRSDDAIFTHSFTVVDTTPPKIKMVSAPSRVEVNKEILLQVSVTDNVKVASVTMYYKGVVDTKFVKVEMKSAGTGYSAIIPKQSMIGEVKYYIQALDSMGNRSTEPALDPENVPYVIVIFDITKPTIQHSPIAIAQEAGLPVTVTATVTDDVKVMEVTLHYRSAGQESFKIAPMVESATRSVYIGTIPADAVIPTGVEYYLKAIDNSGNVTTHPESNPDKLPNSFRVNDTIPPDIIYDPSVIEQVVISDTIVVKLVATDRTGIKEVKVFYRKEGEADFKSVSCKYEGNDRFSTVIPSPLEQTNIYYYISAEDRSGNVSTSPKDPNVQIYKTFVSDPFPPLPPKNLVAASAPGGRIILTWDRSDSPDIGRYNIYTDAGSGSVDYTKIYDFVDSSKNSWESNVLGEGTYKFSVRAVDRSGNEEKNTVVVSAEADSVKPLPPTDVSAKSVAGGKIEVTWSLSLSKDAFVYNIYWDNAQAKIDYSKALARVNDPGTKWVSDKLRDGVVYRFVVRCQDKAGNEEENEYIVSARADGVPPEAVTNITSPTHRPGIWTNQTKIKVTWTPANDAISGLAGYSAVWDTNEATIPKDIINIDDPNVNEANYEPLDILSRQGYAEVYFHIRAVDKAGNWGAETVHFGPFRIDNKSPDPPRNFSSRSIAGGRIELAWEPSRSDDVVKYNVYWDAGSGGAIDYNKPLSTVLADGSTSYRWQSSVLQDGRVYQFVVRAEDRAGNEEKNIFISRSGSDSQPPTITHKPITAVLEQESISVSIYANVDDASGIGVVKLYYKKHGTTSYLEKDMELEIGNLYRADMPPSVFSTAGVDYYISATDVAGNVANSPLTYIAVVKSIQITIDPSVENEINLGDGCSIYFPAGSVTPGTKLNVTIPKLVPEPQAGLGKVILSREFSLDKELFKPVNITLSYSDSRILGEDEAKLGIYLWNGKVWEYLDKVDVSKNLAVISTTRWGIFAIIGDYEPPVIEDLSPSEFAEANSRITAKIKDSGSGVNPKDIQILLNGKKIDIPENALRNSLLSMSMPYKLTPGVYTLEISVTDNAGNSTSSSSRFEVTGRLLIRNFFCYPNPFSPSLGANFVYTLTESVSEVTLRIFGVDGKLVKKLEGTTNIGQNKVSWDGRDEFDERVLNNVYICHLEVKGAKDTLVETIKIAGWER